jgi:hypothetical protein
MSSTEKESSAQFLQRVGINGRLWAKEMHKRFPFVVEDDVYGWCCNMLMAGYDEGLRQSKMEEDPWPFMPKPDQAFWAQLSLNGRREASK